MKSPKRILPIIIISQFFCTSLWFAGNGVMNNLILDFHLESNAISHLTSAVQFGFIIGTLLFAFFTIADRFSPSKAFFVSAFIGALFNLGLLWEGNSLLSLSAFRFFTGFFLAGIYPVGMKIAADYYDKGLGKSLGFLVGALVLGTAFPHLLKDLTLNFEWKYVIILISVLAALGGLVLYLFVPDGPYRKASQQLDIKAFFKIYQNKKLKSAAYGYFGHMWELYAFWTFVPIILNTYVEMHSKMTLNISMVAFSVIAIGFVSCSIGGIFSIKRGAKKIAFITLLLSCLCCLISPFMFLLESEILFVSFLLFWGMMVIADSPMFSTLVANSSKPELKGTALILVNSIGFAITIISIQLLNILLDSFDPTMIYVALAVGPILGLVALGKI
ncbi:MAG: MFS transporter [Flavobacteriaceae bacterium]